MKNIAKAVVDMPPEEIRAALVRQNVTNKDIAITLGVSGSMVGHVIYGRSVSHRVRKAIAEAATLRVEQIWPNTYLYGSPRKLGRPKSTGIRKTQNTGG